MTDYSAFKVTIVLYLRSLLVQRIDEAHTTIDAVREAMQSDTKSSAGDKFETGRAMMQQEMDKISMQKDANQRMLQDFNSLNFDATHTVSRGSLVVTDNAVFLLAIGFGKITINETVVFVISPASPFGSQLLGRKCGQQVTFAGKISVVKGIY